MSPVLVLSVGSVAAAHWVLHDDAAFIQTGI